MSQLPAEDLFQGDSGASLTSPPPPANLRERVIRLASGHGGEPMERRRRRYLLFALCLHGFIWGLAITMMVIWPRSYTVESSMILPGSDQDARVDLKEVGQAYGTARSTYDGKSLDPRVNYKEILVSPNVIEAAASAVGLEADKFGEPKVKLLDQSSIMELKTVAKSADLALAKAEAVHQAFQDRLNDLRQDELLQRERAIEKAVQTSRDKLEKAQRDLLSFKVRNQLVTQKQLDELAIANTHLSAQRVLLMQKLARDKATVASLSAQLGVPLRLAGWTMTLHADAVLLEHLRQYASASALVSDNSFKWDATHPKVREATGQREAAQSSMLARARSVLGDQVTLADMQRMALVLQDRSRELLLRDLVSTQSQVEATTSELAELERQWRKNSEALPHLAEASAQLEELERRVTFAEAVFTGAIGKTDVGHTNIFSSYPMVQDLETPSLPDKPSSPKLVFIGAGAFLASLCLSVGLVLAWLRLKKA